MSDTGRPGQPEWLPGATAPTHRPAATPQGATAPVAGGWAGQAGTQGAAPSATEPARATPGDGDGPDGGAPGGRPAWVLPVAIGAAVLVVVGVVVGILVARVGDDGPAPAASTVVLPVPTPAVEPAARAATTAFASALPTTVLQYALEASQDDAEWLGAGALEAYTETFTDGDGGTLTVRAAQLETTQEATALLQGLTAALPVAAPDAGAPTSTQTADADADADADAQVELPQSGDVEVGGAVVGTYTVVDAGDGTGVAVWQNGTAVFQLTAPLADVVDAYSAYGL